MESRREVIVEISLLLPVRSLIAVIVSDSEMRVADVDERSDARDVI